ncbi:hypothetical protein ACIPSH_40830 [Streptomyces iakyrus]|uniref:hypothetical protein n=1 Tax=Streptomyces iakyrus TaxID=68219 RepID=UPI0037F292D6
MTAYLTRAEVAAYLTQEETGAFIFGQLVGTILVIGLIFWGVRKAVQWYVNHHK